MQKSRVSEETALQCQETRGRVHAQLKWRARASSETGTATYVLRFQSQLGQRTGAPSTHQKHNVCCTRRNTLRVMAQLCLHTNEERRGRERKLQVATTHECVIVMHTNFIKQLTLLQLLGCGRFHETNVGAFASIAQVSLHEPRPLEATCFLTTRKHLGFVSSNNVVAS